MAKDGMIAVLRGTTTEVKIGDAVTTFRGERGILTDYRPERNRIYVDVDGRQSEWYPAVCDLEFVEEPK